MKEYFSENHCPKCFGDLVSTKYHEGKDCLERKCARCGYKWDEATLDKEAKK